MEKSDRLEGCHQSLSHAKGESSEDQHIHVYP